MTMDASLIGFSAIEREVIKEFLRSCTIPLVREFGDQLVLMGTGTFFQLEEHLWLVTAAHVIPDEEQLRELCIPMATAEKFLTLGNCILGRPNNTHLDLDVAIVLIQDTEFQRLVRQNWRVLDESNTTRFDPTVSTYVVAGYPLETLAKTRMNWLASFTQVYTNPYPGGVDDADHPMLRLNYSRSAPDSSGKLVGTPRLNGVSGASIWALTNDNPGDLWTPSKILKVVAIQVSFKHDAYIGAEWWTLLKEVLRRWTDGDALSGPSGKRPD
jgi:hypothetical protein